MKNATTSPRPKQRQPKQRTCRLTHTGGGAALVIRQRQGTQAEQVDAYFLEPIASQMGGTNGVSPGMANLFTSIAISMYCPSMMASLANGNWIGQGAQMGLPGLSGLGIPGF